MKKSRARMVEVLFTAVCVTAVLLSGLGGPLPARADVGGQPAPPPPPNDDFADAEVIDGLPYEVADLDISGATNEVADPDLPCGNDWEHFYTVWYRYTAPGHAFVTIRTDGSTYDTVLAVWTGSWGSLTNVDCNDDTSGVTSQIVLETTAGVTYYIEAIAWDAGGGLLTLDAGAYPDDFDVPWMIRSLDFTSPAIDIGGATTAGDDPPVCILLPDQRYRSIWFSYRAPVSMEIGADTQLSDYDTVLAVWTGSRGSLTQVACNDDDAAGGSRVRFAATAGETYYFEVADFNDGGGTLQLRVTGSKHIIGGNTGVGEVALTYEEDSVTKQVFSRPEGVYQIAVPAYWTGSITPSKTGCSGLSPTVMIYSTPVTQDMYHEDYGGTCTLTYRSMGLHDGWVLESSENGGTGGTKNSGAGTFYLGDDAGNRQYRAILSFDTYNLPEDAWITSAKLRIKRVGLVGADPFLSLGGIVVDARGGVFGSSWKLQPGDFQAPAHHSKLMILGSHPSSGWYSKTITANLDHVHRDGLSQLRLRFATDDNNNLAADYLVFASGNAAKANRPQLILAFTWP